MVIDRVMDERVPAALFLVVAVADRAAQLAMPSAVGDAAELLDIDVDQIPGSVVFVSARSGLSHHEPGALVEVAQERHPVALQYRLNRGAGQAQVIGDAMRSPSAREAHTDNASLSAPARAGRTVMRAAGAVHHPRWTTGAVAIGPLLGRGRRALKPLSGSAQRPPLIDNRRREPGSALGSQTGISVDHEDLSVIDVRVVTTPIPEVLT